MDITNIIKMPVNTEKSEQFKSSNNEYVFEVDRRANKVQIAKAFEEIFGVKVERVRTTTKKPIQKRKGQTVRYTPIVKKAYIRVEPGKSIG